MNGRFLREESLIGPECFQKLQNARVAVFGAGGVGGMVIEQLARCGVGALTVVDGDVFSESNLNRQIFSLSGTLGKNKAETAAQRVGEINPDCNITAVPRFFNAETADTFDFSAFDYVADAIDQVTWKLELLCRAAAAGTPVISCMGTGNKLDPSAFRVADISETSVCPLARVMRKELRRRGITGGVKAVFSTEEALPPACPDCLEYKENGRPVPGSISFVPAAAGLLLASQIVKELTKIK